MYGPRRILADGPSAIGRRRDRFEDGQKLGGPPLTDVLQMAMAFPEARQDRHAVGVDHLRAAGDSEASDLPDRDGPVSIDEDDGVLERQAAEAIDETAADDREGGT